MAAKLSFQSNLEFTGLYPKHKSGEICLTTLGIEKVDSYQRDGTAENNEIKFVVSIKPEDASSNPARDNEFSVVLCSVRLI